MGVKSYHEQTRQRSLAYIINHLSPKEDNFSDLKVLLKIEMNINEDHFNERTPYRFVCQVRVTGE